MSSLTRTIERNLEEALGEKKLPPTLEPEHGVLCNRTIRKCLARRQRRRCVFPSRTIRISPVHFNGTLPARTAIISRIEARNTVGASLRANRGKVAGLTSGKCLTYFFGS